MKKRSDIFSFIIMIILSAVFLFPIAVVFMNSFKTKFSIMGSPFKLPNSATFAGFDNYITGIRSAGMGGICPLAVHNRFQRGDTCAPVLDDRLVYYP